MNLKKNYQYLLLSQYQIAVYDDNPVNLTHENLIKAVTLNENLLSLGYTLTANEMIELASSLSLDTFYENIKSLIPEVKAKPMFPDFPNQVMNMDEATYRFAQIVHYFSTYGIENLYGVEVVEGWLPDCKDTPKIEEDDTLIKAKVLKLLPCKEQYSIPYVKAISKCERMTEIEKEIVKQACKQIPLETIQTTPVQFKENLLELSWILFNELDKNNFQDTLFNLCQHTGDVLKVIEYIYKRNHYHFKTSQKRSFVKVLERYPAADLEANMIISLKRREDVVKILQGLDYQNYSRSPEHLEEVRKLRNKESHSWNSRVEALLKGKDSKAISFIGQRPGMLLRMVARLLRLGYEKEKIKDELILHSDELSLPTLVTTLTYFGSKVERSDLQDVYSILLDVFAQKIKSLNTPLKNKKIYLDEGNISLENSILECSSKSSEGGYFRSGLAYKIPENISRLRFFVYWNDKERVDVDLHAYAIGTNKESIHVGWNGSYKQAGIATSGDITHSNAAEYIDIDLNSEIELVQTNIDLFSGKSSFKEIKECFVGILAVNKLGERIKLYNPKNCIFSHYLRSKEKAMQYGYIDVKNRLLVFNGKGPSKEMRYPSKFSIKTYLDILCLNQQAEIVGTKEEADIVLTVEKGLEEKEVSLIDNNFFIE